MQTNDIVNEPNGIHKQLLQTSNSNQAIVHIWR